MRSECCQAETIIENNSEWCTGCGKEIRGFCQWVVSYNNPNQRKLKYPVYSRTKRFKNYVTSLMEKVLFINFDDILDVFGLVEFNWNIHGCPNRYYFFNKSCVLYYILNLLDLDVKIRTLKDKERVKTQFDAIEHLLSNAV